LDLRTLPEEAVRGTQDFRCLQSQFSLLYNESLQVKTQLDEARAHLLNTKNSHLRQIERMESEELSVQKKLRTEVIQLEDTLAQVRKEYEMLRIEFEQNLAANEQAGPINREMRHLIGSLQNHNHQLKGDVQRYKRKVRDAQGEIRLQAGAPPCPPPSVSSTEVPSTPVKEEEVEVKKEPPPTPVRDPETPTTPEVKKEEEEPKKEPERSKTRERELDRDREKDREREKERDRDKQKTDDTKRKDADILKQLRTELK
ncbi:hypothetical protein AB205_0210250, partial [Aquarana catesbeiana]